MRDKVGDVLIAIEHIGIAGMLVEIALRLVERDLRQCSAVDRLDEFAAAEAAVPQVLGARRRSGRQVGKIIKRLMMVLEIRHGDRVLAIERCLPSPGIPCPGDAFGAQ